MTSLPHLMSKVISEVKQIQRIPNKRVFKNWGTISPMSSRFPSQSSVGPSAVLVEKKNDFAYLSATENRQRAQHKHWETQTSIFSCQSKCCPHKQVNDNVYPFHV